ncbi:capsule assembly Wzi family protein [Kangiella shandongensis]|uniref:capsule assembly Wzi family protein n=1 Tax=Kangiella shandongensis TaxID=2763258 RepID=UPI001CC0CD3B|nr:capsule assembly Wzi family protein [Kangiella shandongensis]
MTRTLYILVVCLFFNVSVNAKPWVSTDNIQLRADIEKLSREGIIKSPITTWPLMWSSIIEDLEDADRSTISQGMLPVYLRVFREARYETNHRAKSSLGIRAANQAEIIRNYGDERREEAEATLSVSAMSDNIAWGLEYSQVLDPLDGEEVRLDGSYLATVWGNWVISVGAQERWWGPGWDSSLILSNNARPVPSIVLQRNHSDSFETPWLSWIGPWTMTAFAGQLESDRYVKHAKLLGLSISFRPFNSLEIGLRRTAQWGGEGRPETASSFFDMLIGLDNCDEGDLSCEDYSNEPGNQLAGIDFKYHLPFDSLNSSLYGQLIGEDEAGYAPSRKVYQLGMDTDLYFDDFSTTLFLEYADTENEFRPDLTYNNHIYQTGYRTEGVNVASTYDNDTQSLTLGSITHFRNGHSLNISLSKVDMNSDGGDGDHSISTEAVDFTRVKIKYRVPSKYGQFDFELKGNSELIDTFGYQKDRYTVGISWTMAL